MATIKRKLRYRLYIDESGDHTYAELKNPRKRYLGLTGCIIRQSSYDEEFVPAMNALKSHHFSPTPGDPVIFHRTDVMQKRGPFWRLSDDLRRQAFDQSLLEFIAGQKYGIVTVVIDKQSHQDKYGDAAKHPYHYCISLILERYCGYLNYFNAEGDVMAEARGKVEDSLLKKEYKDVYANGTRFHKPTFFSRVLTSCDLKLKPKTADVAGLQLADLIAHPSKQDVLLENAVIAL